jgi:hypothetical protein
MSNNPNFDVKKSSLRDGLSMCHFEGVRSLLPQLCNLSQDVNGSHK